MTPQPPIWQQNFAEACNWNQPLEICTIPELLAPALTQRRDAPALDFRERKITYREFGTLIDQAAVSLRATGIGPGDTVALYLPNTPYHPISFFAVLRTGAKIVHLSALDAHRELIHKLKTSKARALITTDLVGFLPPALSLLDEGAVQQVLVGEDARWGEGEAARVPIPARDDVKRLFGRADAGEGEPWPVPAPGDVALLQFTGGTTGTPKAAMLTHANLTAAVSMYRLWTDGAPLEPGCQKVIAVLPLFHIFALTTVLLRNLKDGNEIFLRQRFDVETLITDIAVKRATSFSGVPTMWLALLNRPGVGQVDFSSLRACVSGGAPLPFDVQTRLARLLGARLNNGWGMTETGPAGSRVPNRAEPRPGLIGIPLPGIDMRIVALDDPSHALPPGEIGEIAIRGPNVFKGYLDNESATQMAFRDGYFLTGDIGHMDEQGLFDIVDRRKNMIISSGYNVYPVAIESAIYEHPAVEEVIVIGIPDAYRGQTAKAFVRLKQHAQPFTLDELQDFLRDRLGRHEMPRALEFRPSLPRSAAGKLLAKVLVDEEREKANSAASAQPQAPLH